MQRQHDLFQWQDTMAVSDQRDWHQSAGLTMTPRYGLGFLQRGGEIDESRHLTRSYSMNSAPSRQLPYLDNFAVAESVCRSFHSGSSIQQRFVGHHPATVSVMAQEQHRLAQKYLHPHATLPTSSPYSVNYAPSTVSLPMRVSDPLSPVDASTRYLRAECSYSSSEESREFHHPATAYFSTSGHHILNHIRDQSNAQKSSNQLLGSFSPNTNATQLWKFLLELLMNGEHKNIITWTGREWEFKFVDKHEVARLWGERKNKPKMNYEKLSRGLRYYYDKNIIHKTPDKRFTYCFVCDLTPILGKSHQQVHAELGVTPDADDDRGPSALLENVLM